MRKTKGRRSLRFCDQVKEELSILIRSSLKDPRIPALTITDVLVSPDFSSAKVFFVPFAQSFEKEKKEEVCGVLNAASGFLRRELYRILRMKNIPYFVFLYDELFEEGTRLSFLIDEAVTLSSAV